MYISNIRAPPNFVAYLACFSPTTLQTMSSHSVPRTATFAWSKSRRTSPLLATGTVSGALDESFSSSGSLELWDAFSDQDGDQACKGRVSANAR